MLAQPPPSDQSLSRAPSRYRKRKPTVGASAAPPIPLITSQPPLPTVEPISLGYRKVYSKESAAIGPIGAPIHPIHSNNNNNNNPFEDQPKNVNNASTSSSNTSSYISDDNEKNATNISSSNPFLRKDSLSSSYSTSDSSRSSSNSQNTSSPPLSPRVKQAPSTVFNPLNPFLASLHSSNNHDTNLSLSNPPPTLDTTTVHGVSNTPTAEPLLISSRQMSQLKSTSASTPNMENTLQHSTDKKSSYQPTNIKNDSESTLLPSSEHNKLDKLKNSINEGKKCLESNTSNISHNISKPTHGLSLDDIHARHAAKLSRQSSDRVKIKFVYPDSKSQTKSFIEAISLDQPISSIIKFLVSKHNSTILSSDDPDDFMLWEVCPTLGLRRALRNTEYIRFVFESWPSVSSNFLQIDSSESRLDISSVAFLSPRRDILQSGPSGPNYYAKLHYQVGPKSWKKCYVRIQNHQMIISRKNPSENISSRDKRVIQNLSEFDIYEIAADFVAKSPGKFIMAIRSQLTADMFVDKKDSLYVFSTDNAADYSSFRNIIFTLRSHASDKIVREHKSTLPAEVLDSNYSINSDGSSNSTTRKSSLSSSSSSTKKNYTTSKSQNLLNLHGLDAGNPEFEDFQKPPPSFNNYTDQLANLDINDSSASSQGHETLLQQQQARKKQIEQQFTNQQYSSTAISSSSSSNSHSKKHPTLIDSIGPQNNAHIPLNVEQKVDVSQSKPAFNQTHQEKVFQPDSLLGQMNAKSTQTGDYYERNDINHLIKDGIPIPSISTVAAANGITRKPTARYVKKSTKDISTHYSQEMLGRTKTVVGGH